ncbi:MAG: hypothetical protein KAR40_12840 [Candidatus Sabulitectum sp.]|nr:hypothetical protein [Candidatus Sabulitectum sp.]
MRNRVKEKVSIRTLQAGILLLLASSAYSAGLIDRMHSIAEQAWEEKYIPDSGVPTTPLTEYEDFEVTELFRAVTIEELEASIAGAYPMAWLEETLKDETIPWEDRYWLDRRVRAAIAQNTHTFFNPAGSPLHINADEIFPGEYYWREHLIVDPEGVYAPEDVARPVLSTDFGFTDSGYIMNPYGCRIGNIAIAENGMSLSRDASIGVYVSGLNGEFGRSDYQYYARLLYPDGSFIEIPFEDIGAYSGTISADGNVLAFFKQGAPSTGTSFVEIMDRNGQFLRRIPFDGYFEYMRKPPISSDGQYASCMVLAPGAYSAVVNCYEGENTLLTEHTGTDVTTLHCSFSPDGNFFCVGGLTKARVINLNSGSEYVYPETARRESTNDKTLVSCSNSRIVTALATLREMRDSESYLELRVYVSDSEIFSETISQERVTGLISAEVSPNGSFILVSPNSYGVGGCIKSNSFIVMSIAGRR